MGQLTRLYSGVLTISVKKKIQLCLAALPQYLFNDIEFKFKELILIILFIVKLAAV